MDLNEHHGTAQAVAEENPPAVASLLISDKEAAHLAGISRAHFHRLRAAGKVGPQPIRLGRAVRYDRQEWIAWIAAKCPDGKTWRAMQAATARRGV